MTQLLHRMQQLESGTVVHVWDAIGPARATVLLQHGFGEYAERYVAEYRRLVPELTARGYEVWAIDLRGHGRSPGRRAVTDARVAVREHRAVRRQLQRRELPIILLGHSFGGLITAASVAADPARIQHVVLTSPVILSRTPWIVRAAVRVLAGVAPAANLPGRRATLVHDPAVAQRAAHDPLMYQRSTTLRVGATALDVADGLWRTVGQWRTPTTVFHGTLDEAADYSRSRAFVEAIGREDVSLRSFDGGFHELLHDRAGDDTALHEVLGTIERCVP